jgi:hypothetical protein
VGEGWNEFVSVDGKFFSSLRVLLSRPGVLTTEYLRGQRVRHLPPLRLYLLCSLAYFLASSLIPSRTSSRTTVTLGPGDTLLASGASSGRDSVDRARRSDSVSRATLRRHGATLSDAPLDSTLQATADSLRAADQTERYTAFPGWLRHRLARGVFHVMRDKKNFTTDIKQQTPRMMFVLMPAFALLLALTYRSRHKRYPAHLIVSLHLHAFAFAMLTLAELRQVVPWGPVRTALGWGIALWMVAYVPRALRGVYGGRLSWAIARSAFLAFAYSVVGLAAFLAMAVFLVALY